jgi:hypothetical protein
LAEIHFNIGPPLPDPKSFKEHSKSLEPKVKAIHSLKGFACAVSLLIPAYHFLMAANAAYREGIKEKPYPKVVTIIFMKEAMFERLVLQTRRLYDRDEHALGAKKT